MKIRVDEEKARTIEEEEREEGAEEEEVKGTRGLILGLEVQLEKMPRTSKDHRSLLHLHRSS